jgi:hypothetical protein
LAPSAAPACGGWIGGFGLEQADAKQPAMLVDALDHLPVELAEARRVAQAAPDGLLILLAVLVVVGPHCSKR